MKINPRELRYTVEIKRLVKADSSLKDDEYKLIRKCKAKVKMLGGNEFIKADAINLKQTANFIIRRSKQYTPQNTDIIIFRDKQFNIDYINELPGIGDYMELRGVII
ncbi:phage head closure protein [Clostridium perfringens]|uniref:phage head closure protein n=1 Tax=Clostridium perfringens TaxID=1502 RepID=UPI001ABBE0F2|nr:phage head closure protein [Clostridium perfringens]MBO3344319.1 phage head closure protein [Clostridium perfringens]MBO3347004.1 phage head closure protein [Clostridium perfringens]MBO3350060.1 phage head closure protein [Clostridium perfringens]MBO3370772.1 phage head closure protein [Clostridium perfringens]